MPHMPMSEHCRKTGEQNCHLCENADCTDNTNASITYLKAKNEKLQKEINEIIRVIEEHGHDSPDAPRLASNAVVKSLKQDLKIANEMQKRAEKQRDEIADECQRFGAKLDSLEKLVVEALITIGGKTIPLKEMVDAVKTARTIGGSTNEIGG